MILLEDATVTIGFYTYIPSTRSAGPSVFLEPATEASSRDNVIVWRRWLITAVACRPSPDENTAAQTPSIIIMYSSRDHDHFEFDEGILCGFQGTYLRHMYHGYLHEYGCIQLCTFLRSLLVASSSATSSSGYRNCILVSYHGNSNAV